MASTLNKPENPFESALAWAEALGSQGPEWLQAIRKRGLESHLALGIPTTKDEEWKYTPLRTLHLENWNASEPGPAVFDHEIAPITDNAIRIVMVNGRFDRNLSQVEKISGLRVTSLYNAIIEDPTLVQTYLGKIAPIEEFTFAALNTALFQDGVVISIEADTDVEPVIDITHISTGDGSVHAPRCLIIAHQGAKANIFERYYSDGEGKSVTLPVTEVFVAQGADIEHVRLQDESLTQHHIGLWQVQQAGESEYRSYNVAFGSKLGRLDQNIFLDGEGVTTRLDGVVIGKGDQLLDNHTKLDHAYPNGNSFEIYKQIIDDQATVVFNGKIFVHQDAQKTDAKQTNQALLLSPTATIDSKPQLEIFADDVKCTHGATVGQLEDLPLFYLKQRGIPTAEAQALLVYAFATEVLQLISNDAVKNYLEARLYEKLGR